MTTARGRMQARATQKLRRIRALVRKEFYQIIRDPSSMTIGVVMPILMVLLFGYGLSLDVRSVPIAVVVEDFSPETTELVSSFRSSAYFDVRVVTSLHRATQLIQERKLDGIVRIRADFSRQLAMGNTDLQVLVRGTDANTARIVRNYAMGAIRRWQLHRPDSGGALLPPAATIASRMWFNANNDSRYYLVPGVIVLIVTLIGAFLTALVMAREWERGTLESLFVTPVQPGEILLGKTIPYFILGMTGLFLCIGLATLLFDVPLRGSFWILTLVSMLYLLVALGIGLWVSSATRSQFVASQATLLLTFLPALMLSGFLFDLRSMPTAVRWITYLFPARYYVSTLQTLFLAGNVWSIILPNALVLGSIATVLLIFSARATRKIL
ncbi:ABC transporter permease [Rhodopseudomonas palustris]|uniref:ABC-2 n=1 Tax=Rhodopseudomonas palustris (strain BisB18) TaxID=316056 RepID=Q212V2_RHOPB